MILLVILYKLSKADVAQCPVVFRGRFGSLGQERILLGRTKVSRLSSLAPSCECVDV